VNQLRNTHNFYILCISIKLNLILKSESDQGIPWQNPPIISISPKLKVKNFVLCRALPNLLSITLPSDLTASALPSSPSLPCEN
jgi:hypothetical protein